MKIYAVMKTGGKEYRVAPGDVVRVEKLAAAPGATVEIHEVYSIQIGEDITVGSPTVADARVVAEVIEEGRGEEVVIFKKKRHKRYQMIIGDMQSYTALRIREIAVGKSVYEVAAPRRDVAAGATPPPSRPRISKPARKVPEPQAKKRVQPPTPPAPIEPPPPMAQDDAPVAPKVAIEEVHPVHAATSLPRVETAASAPPLDERAPRKRSYRIAALVVALLVIAAGLLVWGSRQPRVGVEAAMEVAPVAATPQPARPPVPQPAAKTPRKETAIKKPAAASAPSAPVQPPE